MLGEGMSSCIRVEVGEDRSPYKIIASHGLTIIYGRSILPPTDGKIWLVAMLTHTLDEFTIICGRNILPPKRGKYVLDAA